MFSEVLSEFIPVGAHTSITSEKVVIKGKFQLVISSEIKLVYDDFNLTGISIYTKFAGLPNLRINR